MLNETKSSLDNVLPVGESQPLVMLPLFFLLVLFILEAVPRCTTLSLIFRFFFWLCTHISFLFHFLFSSKTLTSLTPILVLFQFFKMFSSCSFMWPLVGCLIYELFTGMKLSRTEELRNTASIPKVRLFFDLSF